MKKPLVVCLLGWAIFAAPVWPARDRTRVGVVLDLAGSPRVFGPKDPPSRHPPARMLASLFAEDTVEVPAGSKLVYSALQSGNRYELQGPCKVQLNARGDIATDIPNVTVVNPPKSRAAIKENSSVNLSKYGGASTRNVDLEDRPVPGEELYTDRSEFYFDAVGRQPGVFYVKEAKYHDWAVATPKKVKDPLLKRDRYVLTGIHFKPATRYQLHEQHNPHGKTIGEFFVTRWADEDLQHVHDLESVANDMASRLELWEAYRRIRLYDKAETLLREMQAAHPKLKFEEQEAMLKAEKPHVVHP